MVFEVTTRAIRSEEDRAQLIKFIESRELPFTASVVKGAPRSIEQNKTQRMWVKELEEQGDQSAEEYRAYCKLHFGVPILRHENELFRASYDKVIRPLSYELKLLAMAEPLDFPITRLMTVKQKVQYLDAIWVHFTGLGFVLTEPNRG